MSTGPGPSPGPPGGRGSEAGDYGAALAELYARTRAGAPRDPARVRRLLDAMGVPDPRHVVHVVGTNGKGTVAARIDAGLRAAGRSVARFTSPHVEAFEERITLQGAPIAPREVTSFLRRLRTHPAAPPAAFFEVVMAMALDAAERHDLEWVVLEAGVGAANDATLAARNVRLVIVTNVSRDHGDVLGWDVDTIARDKAEAIRAGVPVVTAARGRALAILRATASARQAPFHVVDPGEGVDVDAETSAVAAAALDVLPLSSSEREAALLAARRPPRLPARRERFYVEGRSVLLDGAHNRAAAEALARDIPEGAHLLLGVQARKDAGAIRAALASAVVRLSYTSPSEGPAAFETDPAYRAAPRRALEEALAAVPPGGTLVVTGSFHLAGKVRPWLRARSSPPRDA